MGTYLKKMYANVGVAYDGHLKIESHWDTYISVKSL